MRKIMRTRLLFAVLILSLAGACASPAPVDDHGPSDRPFPVVGVSTRPAGSAASGSEGPGDGSLVVIGDSFAAGMVDLGVFAQAQRWTHPSYVADRLGASYAAPEFAQFEVDAKLQDGTPIPLFSDFRFLLKNPPLVPSPYNIPPLPTVLNKQRPTEEHSNLAVPGETLAGALRGPNSAVTNFLHSLLNGEPYFDGFGGGSSVSQVDIALALDPAPTTVMVELGWNDLVQRDDSGVWSPTDPVEFDADYRELLAALHGDNPDALIIGANVPDVFRIPSNAPTPSEADAIFGLPDGTVSALLGSPAADSRFSVFALRLFLTGGGSPPPPLTALDLATADLLADAYNLTIQQATSDVGGVYVDRAAFFDALAADGLDVTIDEAVHHLDLSYGGGLISFDGVHPGNTWHALYANVIIAELNAALAMSMPPVDIDAVAVTDKHVLRALGLDLVITPGGAAVSEGDDDDYDD